MTLDELNRLKAIATGSLDAGYELPFKDVVALIAEVERLRQLLREIREFGLDDYKAGEQELYAKIDDVLDAPK